MDWFIKITEKKLEAIGVDAIPVVYVYNKSDRLDMVIPKVVREGCLPFR